MYLLCRNINVHATKSKEANLKCRHIVYNIKQKGQVHCRKLNNSLADMKLF